MACMCGGCDQCLHDQGQGPEFVSEWVPECSCGQPLEGGENGLCVDCVREARDFAVDCAEDRVPCPTCSDASCVLCDDEGMVPR